MNDNDGPIAIYFVLRSNDGSSIVVSGVRVGSVQLFIRDFGHNILSEHATEAEAARAAIRLRTALTVPS